MIKKIKQSTLDQQYIASRPYIASPISVNFKSVIVNKPWGHEYLMFSNPETEVWSLSLRHQRSTSMHCHPNKRTSLVIIEGRAIFSTLNESWELLPMDTMIIDQGVFHSTQCVSKEGLRLLEFESPPMKHDLLRLEDKYGRAQKGYEGAEGMIADSKKLRLFGAKSFNQLKDIGETKLYLKKVRITKDIIKSTSKSSTLAALLGGSIKSKTGERMYFPTNVIAAGELKDSDYIFENATVLLIGKGSL